VVDGGVLLLELLTQGNILLNKLTKGLLHPVDLGKLTSK
jgi:hypothetical protein